MDVELIPGHEAVVGGSGLRRLLPSFRRRMVGAWCFLDHYGPDDIADGPGMGVGPHPHTGLQTVSWLLDGAVQHDDSIGSSVEIRPGSLGLMTAGHGIAHSEFSPADRPRLLHGAQLWVALPAAVRDIAPAFEHHRSLPAVSGTGWHGTLLVGSLDGALSPATVHTPLVGVDLAVSGTAVVPLHRSYEHALMVASGAVTVAGDVLEPGALLYIAPGAPDLRLVSEAPARVLLLGGEPFDGKIVMWWNFVGGSDDEVRAASEDWTAERRFGPLPTGARIPAPPLPDQRLIPRGRTR